MYSTGDIVEIFAPNVGYRKYHLFVIKSEARASSDHHLERVIVTREDGEAVWAEPRLDQAAWAVVRPVRSAFQFHGSRRSS